MIDKTQLRREVREKLQTLTSEQRKIYSAGICGRLCCEKLWNAVGMIGIFSSGSDEPDLEEFVEWAQRRGKRLFLPRFNCDIKAYEMVEVEDFSTMLREGRYHIPEPLAELPAASRKECDELLSYIIPGMAFDRTGNRLGRGRGYYDRLLAGAGGRKLGVFFSFQELGAIPGEAHDRRLDMAVTEKEMIYF